MILKVVLEPTSSASSGNLITNANNSITNANKFSSPTPNVPNQKLWEWGSGISNFSPSDNFDTLKFVNHWDITFLYWNIVFLLTVLLTDRLRYQ